MGPPVKRRSAKLGTLIVTTMAWTAASGSAAHAGPEPTDEGAPPPGVPAPKPPDGPAEVVITEEARKHFARGVELLEQKPGPDYREAYRAFRAAYAAAPSPKISSNLGLCAMQLERDGEAIESYERYLAVVDDIDPRERAKILSDLEVLRARVAHLELTATPKDVTVVDERLVDGEPTVVNRYELDGSAGRLGLRAGTHRLSIERAGYEPARLEVDLAPGDDQARSVTLSPVDPPPEPPTPPPPPSAPPEPRPTAKPTPVPVSPPPSPATTSPGIGTAAWAMIGVTSALGVGAGVVGGLALQRKSTYEDYRSGGSRVEAESIRSQGETLNIATDVLLGATVASAAIAVVLLITGDDGKPAPPAAAAVRLSPALASEAAGLTATARF